MKWTLNPGERWLSCSSAPGQVFVAASDGSSVGEFRRARSSAREESLRFWSARAAAERSGGRMPPAPARVRRLRWAGLIGIPIVLLVAGRVLDTVRLASVTVAGLGIIALILRDIWIERRSRRLD